VIYCSCSRKECTNGSFYNVYKEKYLGKDTSKNVDIVSDLRIKTIVFSKLCIGNSRKKVLMVESRASSKSFFSNGLIFIYDDSSTYNYKLQNQEILCEKGKGKNIELNRILEKLKKNFQNVASKLQEKSEKIPTFDGVIINTILFDNTSSDKIKEYSFTYFDH
jgi:hypothetical protein